MMTYDDGSNNIYGGFPIFQCSPLDATPACKQPGWSTPVETQRGQYCHFTLTQTNGEQCLKFDGYHMDKVKMSHLICPSTTSQKSAEIRNWPLEDFENRSAYLEYQDRLLTINAYSCPQIRPKEFSRLPLAFWLFIVVTMAFYSIG